MPMRPVSIGPPTRALPPQHHAVAGDGSCVERYEAAGPAVSWGRDLRGEAAPRCRPPESAPSGDASSTAIERLVARATGVPGYGDPEIPAPGRGTGPTHWERAEELANSITHGVGLLLSIAGLYALVLITGESPVPGRAVGCGVYGASLVLVYASSTLYHSWRRDGAKRVLLLLDHIAIYVLIAGTYTPLALIPPPGPSGWALLALVWGFALAGSIAKIGRVRRLDEDSPWSYLVMGWIVLASSGRIVAAVPTGAILWIVAGGLFYTGGLVFFIQGRRPFNHAIWHLFALAGSICHYRAVIGCVSPMAA